MKTCARLGRLLVPAFLVALSGSALVIAQQVNSLKTSVRDLYARPAPDAGGIHEVIPERFAKRYQEWKEEFLSTDIGK